MLIFAAKRMDPVPRALLLNRRNVKFGALRLGFMTQDSIIILIIEKKKYEA
jgi:hypothetical protein